jgi:hypothetical protein
MYEKSAPGHPGPEYLGRFQRTWCSDWTLRAGFACQANCGPFVNHEWVMYGSSKPFDSDGEAARTAPVRTKSLPLHGLHWRGCDHRNLDLEHACWKKGRIFFSWSPPYFVKWREVLLSPVKMFQCSKLPCQGWRSADFLQGFFAQNVYKSCSNMRVLVLRFLWFA